MSVVEQEIKSNGIMVLTINRADKLNALSYEVLQAFEENFQHAKNSEKVKGILITGSGEKAFCAGADINRLSECDGLSGYDFAIYGQKVFRVLEELTKPSLALINGYAFGGGLELAMATTIRVASPNAQFGQPEVKLGIIPGYGGTQRLARLVGKGRAMDLCLTSRFIDAQTALLWGLVTHVFDNASLHTKGEEILLSIMNMAPLAVASVMDVIDKGYDLPLLDALQLEALHFAKLCATEDKKIGVNAFLNKEKAKFQGK